MILESLRVYISRYWDLLCHSLIPLILTIDVIGVRRCVADLTIK